MIENKHEYLGDSLGPVELEDGSNSTCWKRRKSGLL